MAGRALVVLETGTADSREALSHRTMRPSAREKGVGEPSPGQLTCVKPGGVE